MKITEEKIEDLNALLKVTVEPEDYSAQYQNELKNYRKRVNMPGFRTGKAPISVIKNRYGKSLLADVLNKTLQEAIENHLREKKTQVLGSPIPSEEHAEQGDWNNPSEFEFFYEIGFAPDFEVKIDDNLKLDYLKIAVDDTILNKQIEDVARRYGKLESVDVSGENDMLLGDFVELDSNGEIKAGGIFHDSTISIQFVEDADTAAKLTGLKAGDSVVVDPHKVSRGHEDLAQMLGITHEEVHDLSGDFQFNVKEIKRLTPAAVDQDLFDKIYGEANVKDLEEFKNKFREELSRMFSKDSDRLFKRDLSNKLIAQTGLELPDNFLKKWIKLTNEKPVTMEQIEEDYAQYRKSMQWQLIFNKLVADKVLEVTPEEVTERVKKLLAEQYAQYGLPAPDDKDLEENAKRVLSNRDEGQKVFDMLYDEKLIEYVRQNANVTEKEVSYDAFVERASAEQ